MLRIVLFAIPTLLFAIPEEDSIFWKSAEESALEQFEGDIDPSEWPSDPFFSIEVPLSTLFTTPPGEILQCKGIIGGLKVDFAIACAFFNKLNLSEEEIQSERVDLIRHIGDLLPSTGRELGLLTYQNGIRTPLSAFLTSCRAIIGELPEGTLFIGMHNKTKGISKDLFRLLKEIAHVDTPAVLKTRTFLKEIAARVHAKNPTLIWGCILHSEAGALTRRAIEGLEIKDRIKLQDHLYLFAMTPVLPIPANYGYYTINLYSKSDFLSVGGYLFGIGGRSLVNILFGAHDCRMLFLTSKAAWTERTLFFFDHAFLGSTYFSALEEQMYRWRSRYGFYDGR